MHVREFPYLQLRAVVLVDFGSGKVHVQNALCTRGIPKFRMVLDHVAAQRDHQISLVDCECEHIR